MEPKEQANQIIKENDFRKQIKSGLCTGYLFFGEEDYTKQFAAEQARDALCSDPTLAAFNEVRMDALTYSYQKLTDAIMAFPMMADRKLIYIGGLDLNTMKPTEFDLLCTALSTLPEYDYNTVILSVPSDCLELGTLPKRPSQKLKRLAEYLVPVHFEKNSPARLAAWAEKHFAHNGITASVDVCAYMVDFCGRDMFRLASEIDKVSYFVLAQGRNSATREDVDRTATSTVEFDSFALTNAITAKNRQKALAIFSDMKARRVDPIMIMSEITNTVCNMCAVSSLLSEGLTQAEISSKLNIHSYTTSLLMRNPLQREAREKLLLACHKADLDIKLSRDGYSTIEELICII